MPSSKGLPELEAGAQTSQPAHILEVEGLRISVPRGRGRMLPIVDTADFQLRPRESLGIVGESGSGKTMLCLPPELIWRRSGKNWKLYPVIQHR